RVIGLNICWPQTADPSYRKIISRMRHPCSAQFFGLREQMRFILVDLYMLSPESLPDNANREGTYERNTQQQFSKTRHYNGLIGCRVGKSRRDHALLDVYMECLYDIGGQQPPSLNGGQKGFVNIPRTQHRRRQNITG